MYQLKTERFGLLGFHDTGAPGEVDNYTTLIIIHGHSWHSGVFLPLAQYAKNYNTRLILINRRDYPGSERYSAAEFDFLSAAVSDKPPSDNILGGFIKERVHELADSLIGLFSESDIPKNSVVLTGWSLGCVFAMELLAQDPPSRLPGVNLQSYIRAVNFYDPPYHTLGYPLPEKYYHPLEDQALTPGERLKTFPLWLTGYYQHGETVDELDLLAATKDALKDPLPTIATMKKEDLATALHTIPDMRNFTDGILLRGYQNKNLGESLRSRLLYPSDIKNSWANKEVRYIWCDMSPWVAPWGFWKLQEELEDAKKLGKSFRTISVLRLRGCNHFAHWDRPEFTLKALISEEVDKVYRSVSDNNL